MRAQFIFEFARNPNSKFYASPALVDFIIRETDRIVKFKNVSEIIEPATGGGAFIPRLDAISQQYGIPVTYLDLTPDPGGDDRIIPMDFITEFRPEGEFFDPNRLVITGPPYGDRKVKPSSTRDAQKFGTKAAQIAGHIAFIAPVSWLIDPYPAPKVKIMEGFDLTTQKFSDKFDIKTAVVICESLHFSIWKAEREKFQNFSQLDKDFLIRNWRKGNKEEGWDYFVNAWGERYSGTVYTTPYYPSGKILSGAIAIKILSESKRKRFDLWISHFKENYQSTIEKYSCNTDNIIPLKLFKLLARKAMYP